MFFYNPYYSGKILIMSLLCCFVIFPCYPMGLWIICIGILVDQDQFLVGVLMSIRVSNRCVHYSDVFRKSTVLSVIDCLHFDLNFKRLRIPKLEVCEYCYRLKSSPIWAF